MAYERLSGSSSSGDEHWYTGFTWAPEDNGKFRPESRCAREDVWGATGFNGKTVCWTGGNENVQWKRPLKELNEKTQWKSSVKIANHNTRRPHEGHKVVGQEAISHRKIAIFTWLRKILERLSFGKQNFLWILIKMLKSKQRPPGRLGRLFMITEGQLRGG